MSKPEPGDKLLTPREVAKIFCVDPKTVTRWAKHGRIPVIRTPGGHRRYRESAVLEMYEEVYEFEQPSIVRDGE